MTRRLALGATALLVGVVALTGCADSAAEGDCSARLLYDGITYRSHNRLVEDAPSEPTDLGRAEVLGCGDDGKREVVDTVAVRRITGVDPTVAVAVNSQDWQGTYAAEETGPDDWPEVLLATQD